MSCAGSLASLLLGTACGPSTTSPHDVLQHTHGVSCGWCGGGAAWRRRPAQHVCVLRSNTWQSRGWGEKGFLWRVCESRTRVRSASSRSSSPTTSKTFPHRHRKKLLLSSWGPKRLLPSTATACSNKMWRITFLWLSCGVRGWRRLRRSTCVRAGGREGGHHRTPASICRRVPLDAGLVMKWIRVGCSGFRFDAAMQRSQAGWPGAVQCAVEQG